jgi:hypothetical protein
LYGEPDDEGGHYDAEAGKMYEVDGRGRVDREMRMLRDAMLETFSREERDSQRSSFSLILDGALMLVR